MQAGRCLSTVLLALLCCSHQALAGVCYSDEFTCDNGECVPDSYVCDGDNDCGDNSDEDGCATTVAPTTSSCYSFQFTCDNGECEPDSHRCDDYDDCGDNSDEEGCDSSGSSSGLAVGLTIGVLLLIPFIGIPVCIGIKICYSSNGRSQRPLRIRTRVVATTPTTGATVVTSNQTTAMTNPSLYAQPQYPQQPQPPVLYTQPQYPQYPQQPQPPVLYTQPQYPQYPQHPVHEDAQLSFHEPPPSYDDVIAAGSPTQPVNVPYPVQNQAYPGYPPAGPPPNQTYPPPTAPPPHDVTGNFDICS